MQLKPKGRFELDLDYFLHHREGVDYSFDDQGFPTVAPLFSTAMVRQFGPPRVRHAELTQRDKDLAASLQKCLEKAYFHILNHLHELTDVENLCLAGGVALNSVANGQIFEKTPFRRIYTQPAASDDGTAVGVAYYIHNCILKQPRSLLHGPCLHRSGVRRRRDSRRLESGRWDRHSSASTDGELVSSGPRERSHAGKSSAGFRGRWNGARGHSETARSSPTRACPQ